MSGDRVAQGEDTVISPLPLGLASGRSAVPSIQAHDDDLRATRVVALLRGLVDGVDAGLGRVHGKKIQGADGETHNHPSLRRALRAQRHLLILSHIKNKVNSWIRDFQKPRK